MKPTSSKIICVILFLVLVLTTYSIAIGETTLYLAGCDQNSEEYQMFTTAHPELTVNTETNIYLSTNEIISAFLTGEFPFDTFVMTSSSFDIKQILPRCYEYFQYVYSRKENTR